MGTLALTGSRRLIGAGATQPVLTRADAGPVVTVQAGEIGIERIEVANALGPQGPDLTSGHGILCVGGGGGTAAIRLVDAVLRSNQAMGFSGSNCTANFVRSRFVENERGIGLVDSTATIDACEVSSNSDDGVLLDIGLYTMTNSLIARNGRSGINFFSENASSRIEFNTIVDNGRVSTATRRGFVCNATSGSFGNNIIARNQQQQTSGTCAFPNSIIVDADIAPIMFVSPDVAPFDYHIQAGSLAVDAATITTNDHDIDGDARPSDAADVGADEL
jgi:hypothetical protein